MTKSRRNQRIKIDKLKATSNKLENLKQKPKQELNLRESILYLKDKIKAALKKGYSYQDLAEILVEQDIVVSAATLKKYLTESNTQSKKRSKQSSPLPQQKSTQDLDNTKNKREAKVEPKNNSGSPSKSRAKQLSEGDSNKTTKSTSTSGKTNKDKLVVLSGLKDDLSNEFNQY